MMDFNRLKKKKQNKTKIWAMNRSVHGVYTTADCDISLIVTILHFLRNELVPLYEHKNTLDNMKVH